MVRSIIIDQIFLFRSINIDLRLVPESRRWYVNSHRVSRVNKLLQMCSTKQTSSLGLNKVGSSAPNTVIFDKQDKAEKSLRAEKSSLSCFVLNQPTRTITVSLFLLWFV